MAHHETTTVASRGKWRGILMELGMPESFLRDQHGPCPMCGGTDRFRFDDKAGHGTYICGQCGAGDGMMLAIKFTGLGFKEAADRIDAIIRNVKPDSRPHKPEISDDERRAMLRALWNAATPLTGDDLASRYLASRGLTPETGELRFARAERDGEGGVRPVMVARVLTADGSRVATLHRTFLRPDGLAKAEMERPRKLMPGPIPEGSAVRLGPANRVLGIAEGIETALAASELFELPVWAALNAGALEKWTPPAGTEEVVVFGDHDASFAGQAAAYALASRLKRNLDVTVKLPPVVGDWNDVLLTGRKAA